METYKTSNIRTKTTQSVNVTQLFLLLLTKLLIKADAYSDDQKKSIENKIFFDEKGVTNGR